MATLLPEAHHALELATSGPRRAAVHAAYPRLLARVAARVRKASANRQRATTFAVPSSMYGFPYYDADAAADWLGEELAARGYAVTLHGAGVMAIAWDGRSDRAPGPSKDVYDIAL